MNAILVCVEYSDLLAITLPYNRHHFEKVLVVTSMNDTETIRVSRENDATVFTTDLFYANGALFNKWLALEAGLDYLGRKGLLCIMDADVLWPKDLGKFNPKSGHLYSPKRRMAECFSSPPEEDWPKHPYHWVHKKYPREFSGYSLIFHAHDKFLPDPPWHEINWTHAGGADTFFSRLWPHSRRIRTQWECLHIGPDERNWCGRSSEFIDGTVPEGANGRRKKLAEFMEGRKRSRSFEHERIQIQ